MRAFELKEPKNKLVIFDIDDTLFHTTAKINVIDKATGKVLRSLTNQEFNNYQLQPGEEFDFGEFRSAEKFRDESVPIDPMLDQLKSDLASGHDVVMLTARASFDSQPVVAKKFADHGIDINRDVHLYRAGDLPGNASPANKKAIHVIDWLKTGKYDHVTMYDDSEKNLSVFKSIKRQFPNVDFEAHHVNEKGATTQIEEGIDSSVKESFVEMFEKFLPVCMKTLGLEHLPKFEFRDKVPYGDQPTFGMYVNDEKTLYVALVGRHPNDILRTIAHELVHFKQDTEHQLGVDSGETGSPEENQANAMAGVVMRHFNRMYPEYLSVDPLVVEAWSVKYKKSINCSNPKGFSQRAHCQGRKKNESTGDKPSDPGAREFVSNKFYVKFTDDAMLIYDGGKLVWKRSGNYANPTRKDASYGKSVTASLWQNKHDPQHKGRYKSPYLVLEPADIHKLADEKRIPWDNDRKFMNLSKKLTGKSHLDDMTPEELRVMFDYLSKIKIKENFADGKNPQDKGDSKRHGVPTKASVSTLRKVAKQGGRKGQLAHWMANMKAGRAKKK